MKKLLGILVLGLLWCNVGFAEIKKIPVVVHIMDVNEKDYKTITTKQMVEKDFITANKIWSKAGVNWEIKNIKLSKPKVSVLKRLKKISKPLESSTLKEARDYTYKNSVKYIKIVEQFIQFKKNRDKHAINVYYLPHPFLLYCGQAKTYLQNSAGMPYWRKNQIFVTLYQRPDSLPAIKKHKMLCRDTGLFLAHELGHMLGMVHSKKYTRGKHLMAYGVEFTKRDLEYINIHYETITKNY